MGVLVGVGVKNINFMGGLTAGSWSRGPRVV